MIGVDWTIGLVGVMTGLQEAIEVLIGGMSAIGMIGERRSTVWSIMIVWIKGKIEWKGVGRRALIELIGVAIELRGVQNGWIGVEIGVWIGARTGWIEKEWIVVLKGWIGMIVWNEAMNVLNEAVIVEGIRV
jgi:hypothetical protein